MVAICHGAKCGAYTGHSQKVFYDNGYTGKRQGGKVLLKGARSSPFKAEGRQGVDRAINFCDPGFKRLKKFKRTDLSILEEVSYRTCGKAD